MTTKVTIFPTAPSSMVFCPETFLIDTSQAATDTIDYVATDTWGNTSTGNSRRDHRPKRNTANSSKGNQSGIV